MKLFNKKFFAFAVLVTALSLPAAAQELEMQDMIDRLERMDRDIKALNLKVYRGTDAVSAVTPVTGEEIKGPLGARLSIRLNELENQLRQMNGQIEETAYRISQLNTRLDKLVADVDYRLTALESGNPAVRPNPMDQAALQDPQQPGASTLQTEQLAPPEGAQVASPLPTLPPQQGVLGTLTQEEINQPITPVQPAVPAQPQTQVTQLPATTTVQPAQPAAPALDTANMTPEAIYQASRQMLMRSEFSQAETSFKGFLEKHKDHKLTGNVRYWLGETYYVQGDYPQAAATFLEGYQKSPRGAKAPDSLLKLGMSLTRMEKNTEACATFRKLRGDFPKMPAHLSKTLERERTSAKCN